MSDVAACADSITLEDPARARTVLETFDAGIAAVEPERAVAQVLEIEAVEGNEVTLAAVGKAASAMARAAVEVLGERAGRVLVVSDHTEGAPPGSEVLCASHPVPDATSYDAGERLLRLASSTQDHFLFLVSGGGSSLAEVPADGISGRDLSAVYQLLLESGLPIEEVNTIRTHLSAVKGGRLASTVPAPVTTVVLSDVGPSLHLVASGPTLRCESTPADALDILERHSLIEAMPPRVLTVLRKAKPVSSPRRSRVFVAADGAMAARAAVVESRRMGKTASVLTTQLSGNAADAARWAVAAATDGQVSVLAGETTVEVSGSGRGGRNQEAALAAALAIEGTSIVFATIGTDGVDGPTDAAGAVVDGSTAARIRQAGIDPVLALSDNNSHPALDAAGALIRTGSTGTNVADLWLVERSG